MDTIECDVLAGTHAALLHASAILNTASTAPRELPSYDGERRLVRLELAIATNSASEESAAVRQWEQWIADNNYVPWSWWLWNSAYPAEFYTSEQTRRFCILEQSAMGLFAPHEFHERFSSTAKF